MVDQLEQRLFGPVDVLEDHDQRLYVGELVGELARGPCDLRRATLSLDRFHHSGREAEQLGDRFVAAALDQLLLGRLHRIVVRDPGGRLDHLGQRPVGHALPVRQRATGEDGRALDSGEEFADQAALADTRLSVDGEDVGTPVADRSLEGVLEQLELRRCGRRTGRTPSRAADRRGAAMARYAAIGLRNPRSSSGPADSASMRPTVSRCAASPMRISPGAAACCKRAATLTASPVAKVESVSSTTTSPASMPTRASRPRSRT